RRSGRARHVRVKATDCACWTGDAAQDTSGVRRRARRDRRVRNRRDPPWRPTSGKDRSYKARPKATGVRRESEGLIVPRKAVKAVGGKGPWVGCADGRR